MIKKILVTPQAFDIFNDGLQNLFGDDYVVKFTGGQIQSKQELIHKLEGVDGCIIGGEKIDKEVFDCCPDLKILSRFGVGYDSIDMNEANSHDVVVTVVTDINYLAIARHCLALLLALTNNILTQNEIVKNEKWLKTYNLSPETNTIGLIGMGPIGLKFGKLCKNIGYNVIYYSRCDKNYSVFKYINSIDELIIQSNIISLHLKSNTETKNIIDKRRIDLMENKYFLNTSRGDLVDEEYLYKSLSNGKINGAGLDVFVDEPAIGTSRKIQKLNNVVSTCHVAGYDITSITDVGIKSIENIKSFFKGDKINKIVNE